MISQVVQKIRKVESNARILWSNKKLPAKKLSFRRRHGTAQKLTSADQTLVEKSETYLLLTMLKLKKDPDNPKLKRLLKILWARHISIAYVEDIPLPLCHPDKRRTINSFSDFECASELRFTKPDLKRLCQLLNFTGQKFSMDNRSCFTDENIFLRELFELYGGEVHHKLSRTFGRDESAQSRSFAFFIDYI